MAESNTLGGTPSAGSPVAASSGETLRLYAIVVYALYLAAFCNGFSAVIGLVLAYVKRNDARGTPYESHFTNAIETFWLSLVIALVAIPLWFLFFLGAFLHAGVIVWFLYRTIKGLVRALEARPYQ